MMKERIAIIDGIRTPMAKAGTALKDLPADDLGAFVVREILMRTGFKGDQIDELIFGNVAQPVNAANVARVLALKAGLPSSVPAFTVHRNCASGMESVTSAANKILAGAAEIIIAGGTESMSNIPLLFSKKMSNFLAQLSKSKTVLQKLRCSLNFRFNFLKPEVGLIQGLTDPISGLIMGSTAEVLAREFHIAREEQDKFALLSHQRAVAAMKNGILKEEIFPIPTNLEYKDILDHDVGPRENQSIEQLARLKPYFEKHNGTVTVGNSCQITDGAAVVIVMSEKKAKEMSLKPLGYLREYAYASLEPERMGLGPVYATSKLFDKIKISMKDIKLIELNEAFAAQVIANEIAYPSKTFAKKYLGKDKAIGDLNRDIMNVNGGAIALGHPVGMTGTRLIITLLKELRRRGENTGLATLCVGGGQGAALLLEVE